MAAERWSLPSDLKMEIDLHNEPTVSWVVDYFKHGHNPPKIVLRIKGAEVVGKETKAKEVGVVCFTRPNDAGLEIWFEVLKNKHIKRTILPMATWEHDDLLPKGKGGVQDISDDIGTNDNVDLTQLGKVAQTLVFKKHSDKNFDFVDYMERKGLKITLPSTETNPSESGAAGTSTSGEGSKTLKGKAPMKKLNVVTPKKATTGTVEAPKKATTRTAEAPKKATGTVEAPKLKMGVVEYNDESGDEDTSSKTKKRKAVAVLEKKSGFQPERHVVETDQVAVDVKMQLDPKTKDQFKPEFDELKKWFPLGDKLVYASISQLTDPDATAMYRPCSIRHVAEIQNSMIGSADTPQPATVVPYKLEATGKKNFLNILTMKELKAFIKSGGKFMVISGLHSMKATKNIILSVGGNKDHDLYGRAHQLSKRHIKIIRGDTPENILCKLSYIANEQNKTFAFEIAFVEQVIHGRNQYKLLGSPARAMKGMSNTKVFQVRSFVLLAEKWGLYLELPIPDHEVIY
ncbi:hypothetical protein R1sor_011284 [Riccia sorocarpa]|uniref:Uncharacterized protein n=1 Tax=Riccia sorocarpa TaxID=122646 RepID=A0ABD3I0U1_9MARC